MAVLGLSIFLPIYLYSQFFPERLLDWYVIDNNNDTS